ncbi:MAG: hypothetical protein DMG39_22060 [Acidobacteria bacterium]|nr:MAG: hypothetical protein DMG39_22060 [Acidobacteriota bacterium]
MTRDLWKTARQRLAALAAGSITLKSSRDSSAAQNAVSEGQPTEYLWDALKARLYKCPRRVILLATWLAVGWVEGAEEGIVAAGGRIEEAKSTTMDGDNVVEP